MTPEELTEPWELGDFLGRLNERVAGCRIEADIRMTFNSHESHESFELWAFHPEDPDHTKVAEFAVSPLPGTEWSRLRFTLVAVKIADQTPWEIAGPIATLARERGVAVA